jgi:hypothetical protein
MRKIRYYLTLVTLLASLSGFTFLGLGSGSVAPTAVNSHTTTHSVAFILKPPCPGGTSTDC